MYNQRTEVVSCRLITCFLQRYGHSGGTRSLAVFASNVQPAHVKLDIRFLLERRCLPGISTFYLSAVVLFFSVEGTQR